MKVSLLSSRLLIEFRRNSIIRFVLGASRYIVRRYVLLRVTKFVEQARRSTWENKRLQRTLYGTLRHTVGERRKKITRNAGGTIMVQRTETIRSSSKSPWSVCGLRSTERGVSSQLIRRTTTLLSCRITSSMVTNELEIVLGTNSRCPRGTQHREFLPRQFLPPRANKIRC